MVLKDSILLKYIPTFLSSYVDFLRLPHQRFQNKYVFVMGVFEKKSVLSICDLCVSAIFCENFTINVQSRLPLGNIFNTKMRLNSNNFPLNDFEISLDCFPTFYQLISAC